MKSLTICAMCFGIFSLSSCMRVSNEFIVRDPEGIVYSAELRLCGRRLQLTKSEGELRGAMPITCEGEGSILVQRSDGGEATCRIGYVTPGAEQRFKFSVENGQCR